MALPLPGRCPGEAGVKVCALRKVKDRALHDVTGSVPHTSADTSLRSTFTARSAASRAVRHASLEKRAFVPQDKSSFFVYHVNTSDQFPSWWPKTVTQRSGHSFEARSSGASERWLFYAKHKKVVANLRSSRRAGAAEQSKSEPLLCFITSCKSENVMVFAPSL